ncbi:conserved hypothetical protein [Candidatus Sulfopaludibacter sp. SbA3]|nr:conserved hypothetical protein [Candidatus Sulfopaludibacter sp. SbA3]
MLVRLICWKEDLAAEHATRLQAAGFRVDASPPHSSGIVGQTRDLAPAVILIDLDRMPSHGKAVASVLRQSKSVCRIPLVFAGGVEEKAAAIQRDFPDAVFCRWDKVGAALKKAAAHPPVVPVRPAPYMQQFAGSPLLKKLDLKPGLTIALVAAPEGFEDLLGELPEGVTLHTRMTRQTDLAIWFIRSRRELDVTADYLGARLQGGGSAWVVYPKQTGHFRVDFNLNDVRAAMLEMGLVDYKVCSVDADWTGLKFTRKKVG